MNELFTCTQFSCPHSQPNHCPASSAAPFTPTSWASSRTSTVWPNTAAIIAGHTGDLAPPPTRYRGRDISSGSGSANIASLADRIANATPSITDLKRCPRVVTAEIPTNDARALGSSNGQRSPFR
ncbi:hypothetical protein Mapa_005826 [Marchantia paleacea]|nr:hypothetical protein Mapa_005826 [Marchantia paleacea]